MIEFINKTNIDQRTIKKANSILEDGGLVAFPTETTWCICCSTASSTATEKLRRLKGTFHKYTLTIMCESISQASDLAEIDNNAFRIVKQYAPGPYVFILNAKKNIIKITGINKPDIGIRIPSNNIPIELINFHGKPLFTIAASKQMGSLDWWDSEFAENNLFQYGYELEDIKQIDLILDDSEALEKNLTTVINLTNGVPELIRQGLGVF